VAHEFSSRAVAKFSVLFPQQLREHHYERTTAYSGWKRQGYQEK
jgi:hypothetical protein